MKSIDSLNPEQQKAVTIDTGNVLVLAGAGSGKTSVLTQRIAWLVNNKGISLKSILAVTFTNKAAKEMKERLEFLLGRPTSGLYIGTFHGIAYRLLRQHSEEIGCAKDFIVLDGDDQLSLIKKVLKQLNVDDKSHTPRSLRGFISAQKDEGATPKSLDNNTKYDEVQLKVFEYYERMRKELNALDFSDLLVYVYNLFLNSLEVRLIYQKRFQYLMVDEFQDTNTLQYKWLKLLMSSNSRIMAVGDDDQSIYGWRGAKVENIYSFEKDYMPVEVIKLEQNYRSTQMILDAANAVISNNSNRLGKNLWSDREVGEQISVYEGFNERDEANYVASSILETILDGCSPDDIAILYRSNAQSRLLEDALIKLKVSYKIYGGLRFFERAEIKDVLSYVRLIHSFRDDLAFARVINRPTRGIGAITLNKIAQYAQDSSLSLWESAQDMVEASLLPTRATLLLGGFLNLIINLKASVEKLDLEEKIKLIVEQSGLIDFHGKEHGEKAEQKVDNMHELVNAAKNFTPQVSESRSKALGEFLAFAVLESGDTQADEDTPAINLMTLHTAKGLEFQYVYIVGMEEGMFPTSRSLGYDKKIDEERRLCYVGITRAMRFLTLTYAASRYQYGETTVQRVSRFLKEIPIRYIKNNKLSPKQVKNFGFGVSPEKFIMNQLEKVEQEIIDFNYRVGEKFEHAKFGAGSLVKYEGYGDDMKLYMDFKGEHGVKVLLAKYAKLSKIC